MRVIQNNNFNSMEKLFNTVKTENLAGLLIILGILPACLKIIYDILKGNSAIIIMGFINNKLLSIYIIISLLFFYFVFVRLLLHLLLTIIIPKLSKNIEKYLSLSILLGTWLALWKMILEKVDSNTGIIQNIGDYIVYIKNFSIEDKKEWFTVIKNNSNFDIKNTCWSSMEKEIPWELINNKLQLLHIVVEKLLIYKQQSLTEIVIKQRELMAKVNIPDDALTLMDSIMNQITTITNNNTLTCFNILIVTGKLVIAIWSQNLEQIPEIIAGKETILCAICSYLMDSLNMVNEKIRFLTANTEFLWYEIEKIKQNVDILSLEIKKITEENSIVPDASLLKKIENLSNEISENNKIKEILANIGVKDETKVD